MMDREVLDRIQDVWRLELRAPGAFRRPGRHVEVRRSVAAGLVPQWRARTTLVASCRIARSLGFVELGRQTTYELPPSPPGPATGGS